MTPLIDAVFLLIMFFILTTQITVDVEEVSLPFGLEGKTDDGKGTDTVVVINIRLDQHPKERGDAEIVIAGQPRTPAGLREELQAQVNHDASELGRNRAPEVGPDGKTLLSQVKLRIRADKQAKAEYLREVLQACQDIKPMIYKVEVSIEKPSGN